MTTIGILIFCVGSKNYCVFTITLNVCEYLMVSVLPYIFFFEYENFTTIYWYPHILCWIQDLLSCQRYWEKWPGSCASCNTCALQSSSWWFWWWSLWGWWRFCWWGWGWTNSLWTKVNESSSLYVLCCRKERKRLGKRLAVNWYNSIHIFNVIAVKIAHNS